MDKIGIESCGVKAIYEPLPKCSEQQSVMGERLGGLLRVGRRGGVTAVCAAAISRVV
ncbi:MAG: hypothetical protein NTY87_11990 [Planctomycetia bacterium]|nr:hypothetical protein [Planctomycetia bacterium]